ncbi:MAG: HD domain-containing protein, partial [Clostridia bacterium]|nr:HD domain-containing protein [Clostridia bacterium]
MQADVWCERAIPYIQELFRGDAGGHGADHSLRVYRNALLIAEQEKGCNRTVVRLAALLHDADDHKLFHTENHENARAFLMANQVPAAWIEDICAAIRAVSFSQNGDRV